jgi:hypothetical protein
MRSMMKSSEKTIARGSEFSKEWKTKYDGLEAIISG